jgi:hypothetical protein
MHAQAKPAAAPQAKPPIASPPAEPAPPIGTNADTGWPRPVALKSGNVIWYQPQVESWADQKQILAWSAVSYQPTGAKEPALGTIKIEGPTRVALDDRVVTMDLKITEFNFKTLSPDQVKTLVADVQALPQNERVIDLDRLLAYITTSPLQVKNVEGMKGRSAEGVLGERTGHAHQPRRRTDLESDQGRRFTLCGQHELGSVRAHANQDALRAVQPIVAASHRGDWPVEAGW